MLTTERIQMGQVLSRRVRPEVPRCHTTRCGNCPPCQPQRHCPLRNRGNPLSAHETPVYRHRQNWPSTLPLGGALLSPRKTTREGTTIGFNFKKVTIKK